MLTGNKNLKKIYYKKFQCELDRNDSQPTNILINIINHTDYKNNQFIGNRYFLPLKSFEIELFQPCVFSKLVFDNFFRRIDNLLTKNRHW